MLRLKSAEWHTSALPAPAVRPRAQAPRVSGKFLFSGAEKLYVRGVTYGPFHPSKDGCLYHDENTVERDFAAMSASGINAVRVYTVPPVWLLDAAWRHGLWVMVGIPWEQHITFLGRQATASDIERRVRASVRACERHPAILCFAVGNEIPASIVRWHGRKNIEDFLKRLYAAVKTEDPTALVTYVNFPPTEYLNLDFLDFVSFNVYLEQQDRLQAYLGRLQNIAGNRPLLLAEVGLDSRRNGFAKQADTLEWQIRTVFKAGCSGLFLFAWTDEWSRGGFEIEDWDFGLTDRSREPKPALNRARETFAAGPFYPEGGWPSISVVVCSYNGSRTIRQTLEQVTRLDYPDFEVIVVDDGSTDATPDIAHSFPYVRVVSTPNGGLSAARNVGMQHARGEIIAYIDDDAYPDPHWLHYLGVSFRSTNHVAIGGPNIPPPGDGPIAECVANAPGGPIHVLLTDEVAEHIPGCNFAVRRSALNGIGGFDPIFRAAGDDVDACWRLQALGQIGFAPAAVVWHHRRNSVKAYWKQQKGYGRAEALLERKWPQRYNAAGHVFWAGRLYGTGLLKPVGLASRVYCGTWGTALFQRLYEPEAGTLQSVVQMPEWYLVIFCLAVLTVLGFLWKPLLAFGPVLALCIALPIAQAVAGARKAEFPSRPSSPFARLRLLALTTLLFIFQPAARLWGRLSFGLTPWRRRPGAPNAGPRTQVRELWSERWQSAETWLESFEYKAAALTSTRRGGAFDQSDLEIRGGLAAGAQVTLAIEEHGEGRQLLRWRVRPVVSSTAILLLASALTLLALSARSGALAVSAVLAAAAIVVAAWVWRDCAAALGNALEALRRLEEETR
jgi:O-antigen biosynthesis protein